MKILVVGGGGREHVLIWKLSQSPLAEKIYCAPGNPGISELAECVPLGANEVSKLADYAQSRKIDFTVVGPEEPLVLGIVDEFRRRDLRVFGPDLQSARLEGSKAHAKEVMERYGISTAAYTEFDDYERALDYVKREGVPIVIKADGLAAGKGVTVAETLEDAEFALDQALNRKFFGKAGNKVVVEEFLDGEEITVLAFVDGSTVLPMVPSQDHKSVFEGDRGPNTGGMGAYTPVRHLEHWLPEISQKILVPLAVGLDAEGRPYRGVLYVGLMINDSGPKVVEFNVRFGDPEAQVILPLLENDLLEIMIATEEGTLGNVELNWKDAASVCVIAASPGYPGPPEKGLPITLPETHDEQTQMFHAGTSIQDSTLITSGGRVLGITAQGSNLVNARERAYELIKQVRFRGMHFRRDIGIKALRY